MVAVVNEPASVRALAQAAGIQTVPEEALPEADAMRERIEAGEVQAFAAFPEGFDAAVAAYDPASGEAGPAGGGLLRTRPTPTRAAAASASRRRLRPTSRRFRTAST